MRIAQIAPLIERVPAKKYGGTERVVYELTEELVRRGHEVTLFATGDSITSARLVSIFPKALREAKVRDIYGVNMWTLMNIGKAYDMQDQFDIIHDHQCPISLPAANIARTPVVMTMHGAFSRANKVIYEALQKPWIATISNAQRVPAPNLHYVDTVYNGLSMEKYPFSDKHDGYLLFVGRICMEKGLHMAIAAAQHLQLPLIIAAKLDTVDMPYFKAFVEPRLSDTIQWIGEVDETERNKLMSKAMAFLHPITWREPFGLTLIEAMACGTPVIAMGLGSIPEIIADGQTGFVVDDLDEMEQAIMDIDQISRRACREHALQNFNAKRMTDGYEKVYEKVIAASKK